MFVTSNMCVMMDIKCITLHNSLHCIQSKIPIKKKRKKIVSILYTWLLLTMIINGFSFYK